MTISEVEFQTNHVDTLRDFYCGTLGLPLLSSSSDSFRISAGETDIAFSKSASSEEPFYHFAVNAPENQCEEAADWLRNRVNLLANDDGYEKVFFKGLNSHSLYFYDPTGNLCEFTFRHEIDNASRREFTGRSIRSVSEVGMPVENVPRIATELSDSLDIEPVVDDVQQHSIVAVGSLKSAVVVAPLGEQWYMTDKPSESHPISVTIASDESETYCHPDHPYRVSTEDRTA